MFIDFNKLAKEIQFVDLLNKLEIPYKEKGDNIITEDAVISVKKNLFFWKGKNKGGNVIQFLVDKQGITHREAGIWLKKNMVKHTPKRKIPELELTYSYAVSQLGIEEETAKNFEIGVPKGKTIMAGKVAFRIYDKDNNPLGYIGLKDGWFYPKGFEASEHLYNYNRRNGNQFCVLAPSPLVVAQLFQQNIPQAVGLFSPNISDTQVKLLKTFKYVFVNHAEPDKIIQKLSPYCYVKHGEL